MGSEDLFHRRKAKQVKELARKAAKRESYSKVLIVCEGEKTEPNYFNELKDYLALNSANIVVTGKSGSSPISVVDHAFQLYKSERNAGDPYDRVFCVFDKDTHASYTQAIEKIDSAKPKDTFEAINSVPCFEYWLLLHFVYTTQPFQQTGNSSCCDNLIKNLNTYLPNYHKGDKSIFNQLLDQLPQAKAYASNALTAAQNNGTDNPTTKVHILVEYLENVKNIEDDL